MTRESFIRKWLGNTEKPYSPENRDEMRDDLDRVINNNRPETINPNTMTPSHYQFADKEVIDMMAAIWGNEAARMFLTLSAFKYQMRAGRKTDDPTSDLEKARHCLELATEYHMIEPVFGTVIHHPDNAPDTHNPNSECNKPPQPTYTTANSTANNFDEGWNDLKQLPKRDEFVFVRYIDKKGFTCVQIGRYDPELDIFIDPDGYGINNPVEWKPMTDTNSATNNSCINPKARDTEKENEWIEWNGFLDDSKPEPYLVVDLKITKCSDGEVRYGFGYWNPKTNNWSTLLEFDKSKHNIQWRKIT